jgi:hypothetical protein
MIKRIVTGIHLFITCIKSGLYGVYGWYKISQLSGPVITIFGATSVAQYTPYTQLAHDIAHQCVVLGMSVLTGGGPGVMEAANCGAHHQSQKEQKQYQHVLGISVQRLDSGYTNPCPPIIQVNTFFIRKWLLMNYSYAFIILPGGIGTADELFEVLNLIVTEKLQRVPIVLVGSSYWQPLIDWYYKSGIAHGLINAHWSDLFIVVDSVEDAIKAIKK